MSTQETFFMIKPDGMEYRFEIGNDIGLAGLKIARFVIRTVTQEQIAQNYEEYLDRPFFPFTVSYLTSDRVGLGIVEGEDAVNVMRRLAGVTRPWEADPGPWRARFGVTRSQEEADRESGNIHNTVHTSDSPSSVAREKRIFLPD